MSAYSKIKSTSKALLYFSIFAVLLSSGVSYLTTNPIDADNKSSTVFAIDDLGGNNYSMLGFGLRGSEFSGDLQNFNTNYNDIEYAENSDECNQLGSSVSSCFIVRPSIWTNPSIKKSDDLPIWNFINQAHDYFKNGSLEQEIVAGIRSNYVAAAWNEWNEVTLPKNGGDIVVITSEDFFKYLDNSGVDIKREQEEYCKPTGHCDIQIAKNSDNFDSYLTINLSSTYDGAKMGSLWLRGMDFVLGTVIPLWEGFGMDLDDEKKYLADPGGHRDIYLGYANRKTASGEILYIDSPSQFYLSENEVNALQPQKFTVSANLKNGNLSATRDTYRPYKIKVYIKPESKSSEAPAIFVGEKEITYQNLSDMATVDYIFHWQEIIKKSYTPTPSDSDDVSYDFSFPQQYRLVTIFVEYTDENPDGNEVERTEISFNSLLSKNGGEISDTNNYFDLDASPNQLDYNDTLNVDITIASDPDGLQNPPVSDMDKVDVSLCVGKMSTTVGENCPNQLGIAPSDKVKTSLSWIVPEGQPIGYYTVRGKGFFDSTHVAAATGNEQITISNNGPTLAETNPIDPGASGLINFSGNASADPRGSSITTTDALVNRIINFFLLAIGAFSVIGIIFGGVLYITSAGDPEKAKKGQKTVIYAVYGIVIATLAFVIESLVIDTLIKLGILEKL